MKRFLTALFMLLFFFLSVPLWTDAAQKGAFFSRQQTAWAPQPLPAASLDTVFKDPLYINPAYLTKKVTVSYQGQTWVTGMDAFAAIPVHLTAAGNRIACTFSDQAVFRAFFSAISTQLAASTSQINCPIYDNGAGSYLYSVGPSHLEVKPEAAQVLAAILEQNLLSGSCADIEMELTEALLVRVYDEKTLLMSPDYVLAGECSTSFRTSGSNRSTNISVGASRLNGLVILPGQTVSVSDTLLPRTRENGYLPAGVYANGVHTTGMGGGVCQISSTAYSAVMNAGLTVVERHPHSMPVAYLSKGLDAAIASGSKDFRFRNDYAVPVVMMTDTANKTLTVRVYVPDGELNGRSWKLWAKQTGSLSADTYLTSYLNGQEIETAFLGTSRYRPLVEENAAEGNDER